MTCNSCNLANGFGRKRSRKGKKRQSRKISRHFMNAKDSIKMKMRRKQKSAKRSLKSLKKSMKRSLKRSFGPGFSGQTSYPNVYAPYFQSQSPFVNPSEYYLPQTNGKIQSPGMLYNYT